MSHFLFSATHLYAALLYTVIGYWCKTGSMGRFQPLSRWTMQDAASDLPRILLLGTSVNKDKKGGGHCLLPYEPHYAAVSRITL